MFMLLCTYIHSFITLSSSHTKWSPQSNDNIPSLIGIELGKNGLPLPVLHTPFDCPLKLHAR
jgi:hypothetical protein